MFKEKFFVKKMKGAANVSLNISAISETPIPLIPIHIQNNYEKIVKIIDELEKQVSERKVQSEQLMQAVLREAFEGGK
jgi:type I restriction enzyme S subunit